MAPEVEIESSTDDVAPPPPLKTGKSDLSSSAVEAGREDDQNVWDWLRGFSGTGSIELKLERKWPKEWQGHPIGGWCADFDEPFEESQVSQRFGGGKFQVKARRANPKGGWVYAGARTFEVSGDPKIPESNKPQMIIPPLPPPNEDGELGAKALDHAHRMAEMSQRRAWAIEDEMRKGNGTDPALLRMITDHPQVRALSDQVSALTKLMGEKDQKIIDLMTRKPEPGFGEKLAEKIVADESSRIQAMRAQHESEMRQVRSGADDDRKRVEDRMTRDAEARERAHERELSTLRESHQMQVKSVEQAYEARLDGMKGRIADLERQLGETKTEVAELRSRKEKSFTDSIAEIANTKAALEGLGLVGGESEPPSTIERILQGIMGSPIMSAVANRVENAPPAPPMPQPNPRRRAQAVEGGSPPVEGSSQAVATRKVKRPQQAPQPGDVVLDPSDVAAAVAFLESAIQNGTAPEAFASSARTMVPGTILDVIRQHGVDKFLDAIPLDGNSVLRSQLGRNFARTVAKILTSGSAEPPP